MVACDAILRAAGRPSTFRTGLANMTGPRWYGVSFLLPAFLASQQEPRWSHFGSAPYSVLIAPDE